MRVSCFPSPGPSSERPGALPAALSAKPRVRSFSSSRSVTSCSSWRPRHIRGTGPAAERSGPGSATVPWSTGPSRSGSKAPGFRPTCSISPTSHLRQTPPTPPPRKGPQRPAGAAASSSPSTGASEELEWRPAPAQPVKLASSLPGARQQRFQPAPLLPPPRGLRYAGVPLSDGLMALVRRFKSAIETDPNGRISDDRSWLCSALRPIVTGRGAGRRLRCPETVCLPAASPAWLPAGVTSIGRSVAGA